MEIGLSVFPLDNSQGYIIHRLDVQMSLGLQHAFQAKGFNITPEQWGVLNRLWENEGIHQSALAERASKDRHNITRILNLLEKNGFISRTPDKEDKRRLNVYLTKEGKVGDKIVLSGPGWILPAECTNKENTCLFAVSELVPFSFT